MKISDLLLLLLRLLLLLFLLLLLLLLLILIIIIIIIIIIIQSALQPLWVLACSTIVEYSQQEGFYRVPLPAARQTPNLGGPVIRTFQLPSPGVSHV